MATKQCARCRKLFNYFTGPPLCLECRNKDDDDYKIVKEYLYDNPGAKITDVSSATEVSVSKIRRFLKEGRLEIKDLENFFLECERCGVPIKSGRYCDKCKRELSTEMKSAINTAANNKAVTQDADSAKARMRYLNKDHE